MFVYHGDAGVCVCLKGSQTRAWPGGYNSLLWVEEGVGDRMWTCIDMLAAAMCLS